MTIRYLAVLEKCKLALIDADAELSAVAAGRPLEKETARRVSWACREAYKAVVDAMLDSPPGQR